MTATITHAFTQKLSVAIEAARQAGAIQKAAVGTDFRIDSKSSAIDLVTEIDHQCDETIIELLKKHCPEDHILTEETYVENTAIDLSQTWVVDPLDGTTNFTHGFPCFAVSIAYVVNGVPQIGVVYNPIFGELFSAVKGQGAHLNEAPISTSAVADLSGALLATGFPYDTQIKPEDNIPYFKAFMSRCHGVRRLGSAAMDLAYVACGRLDGFWELRLSPWDVAAGVLLIQESGGSISSFNGGTLPLNMRRINIVGTNGNQALHQQVVDICKTQGPVPGL